MLSLALGSFGQPASVPPPDVNYSPLPGKSKAQFVERMRMLHGG